MPPWSKQFLPLLQPPSPQTKKKNIK